MRFCFLILFYILASTALFSSPVIINDQFSYKNIGPHIEYLEDKEKKLTVDDLSSIKLKWKKSNEESLGFGFTDSAIWIRLKVKNKTNNNIKLFLEQGYPVISNIDLYIPEKNNTFKIIKTGHTLKFSQRPIEDRKIVFPLIIKGNTFDTYFLKYESIGNINIILKIYSPKEFQKMKDIEMAFIWMFFGILIVMVVYNLFIFFSARDISYLYYILYIASFILVVMVLEGTAYQYLWPDSPWWSLRCLPFLAGISTVMLMQFARHFIQTYKYYNLIDKFNIVLFTAGFLAGSTSLITDNYRFSMITVMSIAVICIIYIILSHLYLCFVKKSRQAIIFDVAFLLFFIGVMLYILKTFGIIADNFITNYGMYIGATAKTIFLSLGLADRINVMEKEIQKAEKKYENLVESSNDIIFSLDENLNFLTVNKAIKNHIGFDEKDVINKNFMDFIHEASGETENISRRIIKEDISNMKNNKGSTYFKASFKTRHSHEPKELSIKLEYSEFEGKVDILGKATIFTDDIILQHLDMERHTYSVDNFLNKAELMSHRLTRNLTKFIDSSEVTALRICLREIIINAIEHGNLNIQFEEKTEALMGDNYMMFIQERQKDPRYSGKRVIIDYSLKEDKVIYRITDEGEGFDHKGMSDLPENEALPHGRGLMMTRNEFDIVQFNDKGNQILLIKYFNNPDQENPA